jgi:HTH-type transcriptional regulator/antitoxin HigA
MITNERQYKISKAALAKLDQSIARFDLAEARAAIGNMQLAEAQLQALESERELLSSQITDYQTLRSGSVSDFRTESLEELPTMLIKARIATGLSQAQLAARMGVKEQQIQRYEAEKYSSASLRRIIEVADALGLDVSKHARIRAGALPERTGVGATALDWSRFPIKEMYRRGWFPEFFGTFREAEANAESLIRPLVTLANRPWAEALHRKHVRSGSRLDEYALLAWECRVLALAQREQAQAFDASKITKEWFRRLVQLSGEEQSAVRAKDYVADAGITVVVEPHLPQTYLDGACIANASRQVVIGMTLRFDRLDNFWFVLLHELAHSVLHLHNVAVDTFFDDLEATGDKLEQEADTFASESAVPSALWETAIARYTRTERAVVDFAEHLGISPALVAGKIRREADNYVILNNLVGIGSVRRQFPEVNFG